MKHFVAFVLSVFAMATIARPVNNMLGAEWNEHARCSQKDLPEGVIQVEWLESQANCLIDTGIIPHSGDIYRGTIGRNATASDWSAWMFGLRYYSVYYGARQSRTGQTLYTTLGTGHQDLGMVGPDVKPFIFSDGLFAYNSVTSIGDIVVPDGIDNTTLFLFGYGGEYSYGKVRVPLKEVRIGCFSIERDGELILDLVAVKTDFGNGEVGCFYDFISEEFFVNSLSGYFLIGPDVE